MTVESTPTKLAPSMLPDGVDFDVKDSSFFTRCSELPSPTAVQAQAESQRLAGFSPDPRELHSPQNFVRPPPVLFKNLGLLVKWGSDVSTVEGQVLYAIGKLLKGKVPVPEVYGWRTDGDVQYIYMEHIEGQTLQQTWNTLEADDRTSVCLQLRNIVDSLRELIQDPSDPFVGNISKGPLHDRSLGMPCLPDEGPFPSVKEFHDWFAFIPRRRMADPYSIPMEPFRDDLPDDCAIKFTHSDLHRTNIMISPQRPYRVMALIDWEQSGWFPEYWLGRRVGVYATVMSGLRFISLVFSSSMTLHASLKGAGILWL
ncbi:phosphotransferase enzyme family protein [Aspergillus unguis]